MHNIHYVRFYKWFLWVGGYFQIFDWPQSNIFAPLIIPYALPSFHLFSSFLSFSSSFLIPSSSNITIYPFIIPILFPISSLLYLHHLPLIFIYPTFPPSHHSQIIPPPYLIPYSSHISPYPIPHILQFLPISDPYYPHSHLIPTHIITKILIISHSHISYPSLYTPHAFSLS